MSIKPCINQGVSCDICISTNNHLQLSLVVRPTKIKYISIESGETIRKFYEAANQWKGEEPMNIALKKKAYCEQPDRFRIWFKRIEK